MTIVRQNIANLWAPASPVDAPLHGLKPMKRNPADAVMRAQDSVVTTGRRIVASGGLHGSESWRVPDTDPAAGAKVHPDPDEAVIAGAASVDVTPGCFLRLAAAVIPNGETGLGEDPVVPQGTNGQIRAVITWTDRDGNDQTRTYETATPQNTLPNGSQPLGDSAMWPALRLVQTGLMAPDDVGPDTTELNRWTQHIHAEITVYYVGSPRVVDWHIYEEPFAVAVDYDDTIFASHVFGSGAPAGPGPNLTHPLTQRTATDPRHGTRRLMETHAQQRLRLGPALMEWSHYSEDAADHETGWLPYTVADDAEWILSPGQGTDYDPDCPGWGMGCAGYARRRDDNSEHVLRGHTATVPVYVRLYGGSAPEGPSVVRFATGYDSWVEIELPDDGTPAWRIAYGHLEVPINPSEHKPLQVRVSAPGTTALIWALSVHRADQWVPAG